MRRINVRALWSSPFLLTASTRRCTVLTTQSAQLIRVTHRHKSCGIVGLPNVGKSALFNALTQTQLAQSSNYPFTTIDPNTASVSVIDPRLQRLAAIVRSARCIFTQLTFVDIAGLISGASKGAGLGSKFLSNIRDVSVILHVLRCFDDTEIIHVNSKIDPIADMETVEAELLLADIETLEKRLENANKKQKVNKNEINSQLRLELIEKCLKSLNSGIPIIDLIFTKEEQPIIESLQLLTSKPVAFLCNVDENSASKGNKYSELVEQNISKLNLNSTSTINGIKINRYPRSVMTVCAQLESDAIAGFDSEESRKEFLSLSNVSESSLDKVIQQSSIMLKQQVYYTVGPQEARAWIIHQGSDAPTAAGKIHSDIQNGFINVEVIAYKDFIEHNGEEGARLAGKVRVEGKNYIVNDGDILNFRHNQTKSK